MKTKSKIAKLTGTTQLGAVLVFCLFIIHPAWAAYDYWAAVPGISVDTNWTTQANWTGAQQTYYNEVEFTGVGANANNNVAVNNVLDGTTGVAQMPIWELDYIPTNGNYTTLIDPGITMTVGVGNHGYLTVGADQLNGSSPAPANAVETITITGSGGTLSIVGGSGAYMWVGQGSPTPGDTHNITLDLSGLDNFDDSPGAGSGNFIHVASGNQSGSTTNENGTLYLAKTNVISLGNDFQIGNQPGSNSLTCAVYLGIYNYILTGTGNLIVGGPGTGPAGALMEFNPAFVGGASPPIAYFGGNGTSGRIANFYVSYANGGSQVPGTAVADFTGGNVRLMADTMQLGQGGNAGANAQGTLNFDNGTIDVNNATIGNQEVSSGGTGVGIVNVGSNATLVVNNTLTLAAVTGTLTPGTAGTININGGALIANTIVNGGGTAAINGDATITLSGTAGTAASPISSLSFTNSTLNLTVSTAPTNINTASLTTGGANTINVLAAPVFPSSSYPVHISLIKYQGSIGGAGYDFSLGTLPLLFGGYLSNNTANSSVDLILTNGPPPEVWTAAQNDNWDTTSTNWQTSGNPALYADGAAVQFLDGASNGIVNLTATFNPNGVTVSNNVLAYTWSSSGVISGSTALAKQGPGSLVIDNSGNNDFTGGVTVSGGILQVGNSDTSGNLPAGAVANSGVLVFDRIDTIANSSTISGGGTLVQAGGGTLQLNGGNTFSGSVVVTNGSTLKLGNSSAVGAGTNTLTIASGSTLDANGYMETRPIIVSGTGVGGNGAIIDSGGAIYDSSGGLATNIMLAADTTFTMNSPNRWDLGSTGGGSVLGALGAYNLTLNGNGSYFEWRNLSVQAPLANITVASGNLGVVGTTTFGDPNATLVLTSSGTLQLYGANVYVNKQVDFQNGATILNSSGANIMNGAMTLETGAYCTVNVAGGTTLNFSNVLSGSGVFYQNTGTGTAILSGNSPSFTGGVSLYSGQLVLNGLIGSGIVSQSGTTLSGTGTANGLVDVSGLLLPGAANVAGTFSADGGLTLESGATLTMDLSSTTGVGGGVNDLIAVAGNLTMNGNNIVINPIKGFLANSNYTLFTYTGTLTVNGTLTAFTVAPSRYTLTIGTNANSVYLNVSGQGDLLQWNNQANNGQWDVNSSLNWSNLTTVAEDKFLIPDTVLFDDTITNAANSTTSITIPASVVVVPNVVTNNSSTNYTISGAGKISGAASLVKLGSSKLTISTTNDFIGNVTIGGGSLQVNGHLTPSASAVGATNGTLVISNGATLYVNLSGGYPAGDYGFSGKPIVVGGAGVNGLGAIQNIGNALYDDSSTLGLAVSVTLTTNTTIGGTARLDWGYPGTGSALSAGGNNYNLTIIENQYFQWDDLTIDTNLGNIDIYNSTATAFTWGVYGMGGGLGNPTNVLTLHSNVTMNIQHTGSGYPAAYDSGYAKVIHVMPRATYEYNISGGAGDYRLNTSFVLDGGSTFEYFNGTGGSGSGTVFNGPVTLNGLVNIQVGNSPITFSNVISGAGGFYINQYSGQPPLSFAGTNTYQGITDLRSGINLALIGNGSISLSTPISLASTAALIVTNRTDGTLTLASGQTLEGAGIVKGFLVAGAGSTVLPGTTSTATNVGILTVSSNATLGGNALFKLNNTTNDVLSVGGALTYGGTLTVTNISATPLAAGKSFKLFNAAGYNGAFSSIVTEPPLATGLVWNTNNLTVNGTISLVGPPLITGIRVNGPTLTIMATNAVAFSQFVLLQSTNVAQPLAQWIPVLTNNFDGTGSLNLSTNIVNMNNPEEFYILSQ